MPSSVIFYKLRYNIPNVIKSLKGISGNFIPMMENIILSSYILKETYFRSLAPGSMCKSQRIHLIPRNSLCTEEPE